MSTVLLMRTSQASGGPANSPLKWGSIITLPSVRFSISSIQGRFFQSDQLVQDYTDALAARSTVLGDKAILDGGGTQYGQVPIVPCPLMPTTMSAAGVLGSGVYSDTVLTPKNNLVIGIQRKLKIESQRMASDEAFYWFYSLRMDNAIENVNACVLLEKITTA